MARQFGKAVRQLDLEFSSADAKKSANSNGLGRSESFKLPPKDFAHLLNSPCWKKSEPKARKDPSVEEAKDRVALRFLVKRSRRSRNFDAPCPSARGTVETKGRLKTLMSNIKHSVKSTIANSLPKTKTISQMTNTLVTTLKNQNMPECLKYLGISKGATNGIKRKRDYEEKANHQEDKQPCNQMVQLKINSDNFNFVTPKLYECGFCLRNFYCKSAFFKHIRRHKMLIRCDGCNKSFSHVIAKRRHQLMCINRAIL